MIRAPQWTIRRAVSTSGFGIHSGAYAEITCRPASVDEGIVFVHPDRPGSRLRASLYNVTGTQRGVTLGAGSTAVRTVEHLLAAVAGLGITNLLVEVRGEELPILDGSAAPYCALLSGAGITEQAGTIEPVAPRAAAWVEAGEATLCAVAGPHLRITYVVPLRHTVLGAAQVADVTLRDGVFVREVAPARTWGFAADMEKMRRQGLAAGASLDTALGIGPEGYLNPPRMADEPARHKILDLIGDLALLGRPLLAHVIAVGAGHTLHLELVRRLERDR
ncbi:MAG TPA: UDP-3-O-acyl-N-acetylglucosamine deacetylase [bacterium]|nr:UDP-3-O-acyl-N-acetylglucosamine deacetylase [bacterium]